MVDVSICYVETRTCYYVKKKYSLCTDDFSALIEKWQEVAPLRPDEIRAILDAQRTNTGESYLDVIQQLGSHYSLLRNMGKLVELFKLPPIPVTTYSISKEVAKHVVKRVPLLARIALLSALFEVAFVFEIPFKMWMKFLEAQEDAARAAALNGHLFLACKLALDEVLGTGDQIAPGIWLGEFLATLVPSLTKFASATYVTSADNATSFQPRQGCR